MRDFKLNDHIVGAGGRCLVIGEVAQAHDGSLGIAHAFIDAIANAGADGVKFQTHIADAESTPTEEFRVKFSQQDESRYAYWKRMEFTEEQWQGLSNHARERGLVFLSSPFSLEAVELLHRLDVPAWKVASGEIAATPMFDRMLETRLPILLSTGMSPWEEIDFAVDRIKNADLPFLVFQCSSTYPTPAEKVGLNVLDEIRRRYACPVGLSDHSGTVFPGLAAAALGVDMIEVHVTLSREMYGPDVPASVTPAELQQLVAGTRFIEGMLANPVDKDETAQDMESLRKLFFKSVVAAENIEQGTLLEEHHLAVKKPGTGIPASQLAQVVGKRLRRSVRKDELLNQEDLES
jgi:N,N'-diacetyllegionaminate synthase